MKRLALSSLILAGVFASCSALGIAGRVALETGKNLLIHAATSNYSGAYGDMVGKLLETLLQPASAQAVGSRGALPDSSGRTSIGADVGEELDGTPPRSAAIELDVAVLREVGGVPMPIENGGVLRDGFGRADDGDNLKLSFRANRRCYVYVISVDSTGWIQPVFPSLHSGFTNPVDKGRQYMIPEGKEWYYLDGHRGVETYYFVASTTPRNDLEQVLREAAGRVREEAGTALVTVDTPAEVTRGLGGTRPIASTQTVTSSAGIPQMVSSLVFTPEEGSDGFVLTRWFRHE